jgi:DNA-binding transcriptional LysR family regulator
MDWDDLRFVLAIGRAGTLSAAARVLNVNHTTVGRRLAALEQEFGAALFTRTRLALVPTEAGEAVIAHAERMETEALLLSDRVEGFAASPHGAVRILAMPWMIQSVLIPGLPDFLARYPAIQIEAVADVLGRSLSMREADLALRFQMPLQRGEVEIDIAHVRYALYAPAGSKGRTATLPWIDFGIDFAHLAPALWMEQAMPANQRVALKTNDAGLVLAAIATGVGKGLVPVVLGDPDPALVRLSTPDQELVRTLRVLVHQDIRPMARIGAVIDWLRDAIPAAGPGIDPVSGA